MVQRWKQWNTATRKWLWILVVVGLVASLPLIYGRVETESTAKNVELIYNYRSLLDISSYQGNPQQFMSDRLDRLKKAGFSTIAVFESNLDELKKARRLQVYSAADVANLNKKPLSATDNGTYVLFTNDDNEKIYASMIKDAFAQFDIQVSPWSWNGHSGLRLNTSPEDAALKPMPADPQVMEMIHDKGMHILPRISDSGTYNQEAVDELLDQYVKYGVTRILFDGEAVKGYGDDAEKHSLQAFADSLNERHIGIAAIEGLKKPQLGLNRLAHLLDYNVVRLHSIGDTDAAMDQEALADRLALAVKDRKIRMIYFNSSPARDVVKAAITDPIDNVIHALKDKGEALDRIKKAGYHLGQAEPFKVTDYSWEKIIKVGVVLGGVAFVALLISYFLPSVTLLVLLIGFVGCLGLYVLKPSMLEHLLSLAVAISAPTVATLMAARKVKEVHAEHPHISGSRRLSHTLILFIKTSLISLSAVPFVIALLNNITYSLVLDQFRGVSLLHFVPMLLVAVYVFLYQGKSVYHELRRWLSMPITLLWVAVAVVIGAAGVYYLSRTGNAGTLLPGEAAFRAFLEENIGVRPRNKEFLFAHPLFIAGVFVAFRYPKVIYVMIIAAIGQLSMVDTFAHIHTPVLISLIRGLLGLGFGLIIGIIAIGVWQIIERCWKKWSPLLLKE
ncbi:hypothetical protein DCC85_20220 [Paenibacillus sp. CAA11]|uniref:DUF5693 family protein n=1 Tax=Paenibacillus sp. CAA11 TaxID=1532905 RepID=UPI000D3A2D02|nr:DUF5693 family protein [Paenibacillus sp. CAA11]AWB46259.1 hypothetical protein DCC85_20220 [Paenibacillus sp. CAA11]